MTTPTVAVAAETIRGYVATAVAPSEQITELLENLYPNAVVTIHDDYWAALCLYSLAQSGYAPEDVLEALSEAVKAPQPPEDFGGARVEWDDAWHHAWERTSLTLREAFVPGQTDLADPPNPDMTDYLTITPTGPQEEPRT